MASAASQLRRAALPSLPRRQLRSTRARALQCVCFIGPNQLGAIFSAMRAIVPKPLSQQGLGKVSVFASVTTAALASGGGGGTTGGSGWGDWGGNGGGDGPASSSSGPAGANPVADVSSEDMVEELILLDVGGECDGTHALHVLTAHLACMHPSAAGLAGWAPARRLL